MSKATMFRSADTSVMSRFSQLRMTTAYDDKGPRNLFLLLLFIVNIFPLVTLADDNPPQSIPSRDNRMSQQQISQMGVSTDWQIPTPATSMPFPVNQLEAENDADAMVEAALKRAENYGYEASDVVLVLTVVEENPDIQNKDIQIPDFLVNIINKFMHAGFRVRTVKKRNSQKGLFETFMYRNMFALGPPESDLSDEQDLFINQWRNFALENTTDAREYEMIRRLPDSFWKRTYRRIALATRKFFGKGLGFDLQMYTDAETGMRRPWRDVYEFRDERTGEIRRSQDLLSVREHETVVVDPDSIQYEVYRGETVYGTDGKVVLQDGDIIRDSEGKKVKRLDKLRPKVPVGGVLTDFRILGSLIGVNFLTTFFGLTRSVSEMESTWRLQRYFAEFGHIDAGNQLAIMSAALFGAFVQAGHTFFTHANNKFLKRMYTFCPRRNTMVVKYVWKFTGQVILSSIAKFAVPLIAFSVPAVYEHYNMMNPGNAPDSIPWAALGEMPGEMYLKIIANVVLGAFLKAVPMGILAANSYDPKKPEVKNGINLSQEAASKWNAGIQFVSVVLAFGHLCGWSDSISLIFYIGGGLGIVWELVNFFKGETRERGFVDQLKIAGKNFLSDTRQFFGDLANRLRGRPTSTSCSANIEVNAQLIPVDEMNFNPNPEKSRKKGVKKTLTL